MNNYRITRNGQTLLLSENDHHMVRAASGIGMVKVAQISDRASNQHGDTRLDYRLQPRYFQLGISVLGEPEKMTEYRDELLLFFAPGDDLIVADVEVPVYTYYLGVVIGVSHVHRSIDCYYNGGLEFNSTEAIKDFLLNPVIELYAPDPTFYDPTLVTVEVTLQSGPVSGGMPVPTPVPTPIGTSALDVSTSFNYAGNWISYPTIRIDGPITSPVIENLTTGEVLDFTGARLEAGEYVIINCALQTVTKGATATPWVEYLSDDSDLATFHMERIQPGETTHVNNFEISGDEMDVTSKFTISYYQRFLGV